MSVAIEHKEIRTRFNSQWKTRTPVSWPNASFTPPDPQTPWVRFSIRNSDSEIMDIGSPVKTYRNMGVIFIQIFGSSNVGTSELEKLADIAATIFRSWCGATVRCRAASIKDVGAGVSSRSGTSSGASGWYQFLVTIPYQRDEQL